MTLALLPFRNTLLLGIGFAAALTSLAGCGSDDTGGTSGDAPEPPYPTLTDALFPAPEQAWSHGEPTALEQALLEEMQRARLNPTAEVDILLAVPGVKGAMQQFGTDEQKLRDDFATYSPVPPLSFDAKLMASSRFHSDDMAVNGFQGHDSSTGESFDQRVDAAGYKWSFLSENVFAYADSVPYCHAGFMVDWGNPEPGHRHAILDIDGKKRDVGISIIESPASDKVGPLVVTQDFGNPAGTAPNAQKYIVGVVYSDANGNAAYDPGEGVPGLVVVPEVGDYMAVTSLSGGFSVPMAASAGAVKVQLQLPFEDEQYLIAVADTTLAGENVKLDFVLPAPTN